MKIKTECTVSIDTEEMLFSLHLPQPSSSVCGFRLEELAVYLNTTSFLIRPVKGLVSSQTHGNGVTGKVQKSKCILFIAVEFCAVI